MGQAEWQVFLPAPPGDTWQWPLMDQREKKNQEVCLTKRRTLKAETLPSEKILLFLFSSYSVHSFRWSRPSNQTGS